MPAMRRRDAAGRRRLRQLSPARGIKRQRRGFCRDFRKCARGGADAGHAMASRQLRDPGRDRAWRHGCHLPRPPAALPPHRGAKARAGLSRRLARDAGPVSSAKRRVAAKLDHPNILPIYEVGESVDGLPFFSMKYASGGSLRAAVPALHGRPDECARLMAKVARAIDYAHQQGVLHRDLHPGNILLDCHGRTARERLRSGQVATEPKAI